MLEEDKCQDDGVSAKAPVHLPPAPGRAVLGQDPHAHQQVSSHDEMPITFIMLIIVGRPTNFQQTLDLSFAHFTRGQLTDVCLVPEQGEGVRVHGFMLSAASHM